MLPRGFSDRVNGVHPPLHFTATDYDRFSLISLGGGLNTTDRRLICSRDKVVYLCEPQPLHRSCYLGSRV